MVPITENKGYEFHNDMDLDGPEKDNKRKRDESDEDDHDNGWGQAASRGTDRGNKFRRGLQRTKGFVS